MTGRQTWSYARTLLPALLATGALSYVAVRMGLSEHYKLALLATAVLSAVLALNPGLQRLFVGFLAPLVIVVGFYSQWLPSMSNGGFSPRQAQFLFALDITLVVLAALFLVGSLWKSARLAIWIAVLFTATYLLANYSGEAGGADSMVEWFMNVLHLARDAAERATITVRKCVHVAFYGVVAWSAYWSAWHGQMRGFKLLLYAGSIAFILAAFDESRQLGAQGRSGSGWDILLDMAGAALALAISALIASRKGGREAGALSTAPETSA